MKLKRFVEFFVLQAEIKQKSITFCDFAVKYHHKFCDFCYRIISVKTKFDFCYVKTNKKIARCAVFLFLPAPLHSSLTRDTVLQ